jgi:outer membrane protein assembly factor BamB
MGRWQALFRLGAARALAALALMTVAACGDDDEGACRVRRAPHGLPAAVRWEYPISPGFEGSPALCDLEHDGRLEAIVPVAIPDRPDASYLVVLDAATGQLRWETGPGQASFAYPLCVDVTGDRVDDVLVGGRIDDVRALSGVDGQLIWSLKGRNTEGFAGHSYSVVMESPESSLLFVTTGGGGTRVDRNPGQLLAFGLDGVVRARWHEPLLREIYASPAVGRDPDGSLLVAVGSGGETLPGALYLLVYDEASARFSQRAAVASACDDGGFIASPTMGDVTGDGRAEVVGADFCGAAYALAADGTVLWRYEFREPWYPIANPLLADFNGDGALDVVVVFESANPSLGSPDVFASAIIALDGPSGAVLWEQRRPNLAAASPVAADFDGDCLDDVLVLIAAERRPGALVLFSGASGEPLYELGVGNTFSTPLVGDFDRNEALDVLVLDADFPDPRDEVFPRSARVLRLDFPGTTARSIRYTGFRGHPTHSGLVP